MEEKKRPREEDVYAFPNKRNLTASWMLKILINTQFL